MTRRALVTGASGFVGRHLVSHLAAAGWEVVGLDRSAPPGPSPQADAPSLIHLTADLTDPASIRQAVSDAGAVTHVFHLAGLTFVPDSLRRPDLAFDVNVLGLIRLAEALRETSPDVRLLVVGSSEAYGPPRYLPVDEDHPFDPRNPYAMAKAAADWYARHLHDAGGMDVVRLRPFNHTGPGQRDDFVLPAFATQIARMERSLQPPVLSVGNLEAARDFSHVDDVVAAYEAVALRGCSGAAYNVCSGQAVTVSDLLQRLLRLTTRGVTIQVEPSRWRPVEVPEIRGSHDRLTLDTGWEPRRSLDDLVRDVLDDCRERLGAQ